MFNVFIINVNAGKKNSYIIGNIIKEYCDSMNILYSINYTLNEEETAKIIDKYKDYEDVSLYSVGGDGTLNQIVNYLPYTNIKLNVIPTGTGNDFYKSIFDKKIDTIDIGKVNDKYFINVASIGIDAEMANTANVLKNKNIKGNLVYPLSIIKNYFTYKPINLDINNTNKDITLLTICNAGYYGNGFNISPNYNLNDGLFDVYEVIDLNKIKILKLFLKLIKGKHINDNNVIMYKTDNIIVNSNIELNCNIDGEIIKDKNFNFNICKDAIKLDNDTIKIKELLKSKKIIK